MIGRKILVVILKDDYGDPERDESYEYNYFFGTLERMFTDCRLFDFGGYRGRPEKLQEDLLRAIDDFQPDLAFFTLFEEEFTPEILDRVRERCPTINWFCDDQWRFDAFSSRFCGHFSYIVTTDPYALGKYEAMGYKQALLSQWATRDCLAEFNGAPDRYVHDVSFVGGYSPFRRWLIQELGKRKIDVECFGQGWPHGRVTYVQMEGLFLGSKINLNISNSRSHDIRFVLSGFSGLRDYRRSRKTKEQIKGRHFEINALGGFQLTNYVEFLEDYFHIGREIAVYNALDDLADKIRYYLDRDGLRREIARAGWERVRREHTYEERFSEIFEVMGISD